MTASFTTFVRRTCGVALLAAGLTLPASAQTTVFSTPVGVISDVLDRGSSGLSFPLIADELFVGTATGNTGRSISFADVAGDIGAHLAPDGRYYLEVTSGPLEGERFDLDTAATISAAGPILTVDLAADTFSTLPSVPAGALAGARCAIRPHVTLAHLPSMFTPVLAGDGKHRLRGDSVSLLGSHGFETYYLGGDGASWYGEDEHVGGEWARRLRAWRERTGRHRPVTDHRDLVIPPDVSVVITLRGAAKTWTHEGLVRTNAFRKNLVRGVQAFASGFPVDLSPAQIGAYVDPAEPVDSRWTGSNLFPLADQIEVLLSGRMPLNRYFLRGDGRTWQALTHSWREDFANQPILGWSDMILIRRKRPDAGFIVPVPFSL